MGFNLNNNIAKEMLSILSDAIVGGTGTNIPSINIYSSGSTLLAQCTMTGFSSAQTGASLTSISLLEGASSPAALASGTATKFAAFNKDGVFVFSGDIVPVGSPVPSTGALQMPVTSIIQGIPVIVSAYNITLPSYPFII